MPLQEALNWSENKKLSDLDYRFLGASQELVKREIESQDNQVLIEEIIRNSCHPDPHSPTERSH
jgi:hypothetical protein